MHQLIIELNCIHIKYKKKHETYVNLWNYGFTKHIFITKKQKQNLYKLNGQR